MNSIEQFFLNAGLSWTMSKLLPYLLFPLLGLVIWYLIRKKIANKWLRRGLLFLLLLFPFGAYFMVEPIYEGDFSNNAVQLPAKGELKSLKKARLYVITIPECPFCLESIARMKAFKKRNPELEIEYLVCSSQPATTQHYQQAAGTSFKVRLARNPDQMADVAGGQFPSFVLTYGQTVSKWSNDSFGVGALDEIENAVN